MGAKDSKPSFITYEDAVKRVSDNEFKRLREAFKRCTGASGSTLSLETFVQEVLSDGVPNDVAKWLYQACGGTKRGIAFKDLLCGVVVLTKGSVDEKIKLLWTLYINNQSENSIYLYKWDFARTLHMESNSLPTRTLKMSEILTSLFGTGDRVTFEQFRSWLLIHNNATVMSKWLLTDFNRNASHDMETPTFYQSLAGVTHLEEKDIIELEKCFWSLSNVSPSGQLDYPAFTPLISPPLPPAALPGLFAAFDENRDGHIDFKELCCGLSAACRGPRTERLKFIFKIFDQDRDGYLNQQEIVDMVTVLTEVANESLNETSRSSTPDEGIQTQDITKSFEPEIILLNLTDKLSQINEDKPNFRLGISRRIEANDSMTNQRSDINDSRNDVGLDEKLVNESEDINLINKNGIIAEGSVLTLEDFLIWSVENAEVLVSPFLDLLFEVCHIVLGLRPECRHQEMDIVLGWVRRERSRGLRVGQFWFLVAAHWWARWAAWCSAPADCCPPAHSPGPALAAVYPHIPDDATTNSSESMGSASLDSSSGAGGVSPARPPGPIDNSSLIDHDQDDVKVRRVTGEGGALRRDVALCEGRDFVLLAARLHRALADWYGAPRPLPRQVIRPPNSDLELELYPMQLKILRHVQTPHRGVGAGINSSPPQRYLAYTGAFSRLATVKQVCEFICGCVGVPREAVRLWAVAGAGAGQGGGVLLQREEDALGALVPAPRALLLELRSADLTWPEEITALSSSSNSGGGGTGAGGAGLEGGRRGTLAYRTPAGGTGLHNLGNTCYMNVALQAVWNTGPLRRYFLQGLQQYELNLHNPRGTQGLLATRYAELCKEVWEGGGGGSIAPLRLRAVVARLSHLGPGPQHDAQELLAWLLDRLHEDLLQKSESGDSSIVSRVFVGRLRGSVQSECGHTAARHDDFNMLSVSLPRDTHLYHPLTVHRLDGSVPVRYAVRAEVGAPVRRLKQELADLCQLPVHRMAVCCVVAHRVSRVLPDMETARAPAWGQPAGPAHPHLAVYELPAPAPCGCTPGGDTDPAQEASLHERTRSFPWRGGHGDLAASTRHGNHGSHDVHGDHGGSRHAGAKSHSEMLMSQSPPGLCEQDSMIDKAGDKECRSNTLPKDISELKRAEAKLKQEGNSSPTLSVKSLDIRSTALLSKTHHDSNCKEPASVQSANANTGSYLFAVHRKQSCGGGALSLCGAGGGAGGGGGALLGSPLVVGAGCGVAGRALYAALWTQLAPLLSPPPTAAAKHNHAQDCDDSLGYAFPFTVRCVRGGGEAWCALCDWTRACRGCALPQTEEVVFMHKHHGKERHNSCASDSNAENAKHERATDEPGSFLPLDLAWAVSSGLTLAIDWEPTALHLRYQTAREKAVVEHSTYQVAAAAALRALRGGAGVTLEQCLERFCSAESVTPYTCDTCRAATPATLTLRVHAAPPALIIHLKRFQYVNNKWAKSQKAIHFPIEEFDPTPYLSDEPRETILKYREIRDKLQRLREGNCDFIDCDIDSKKDKKDVEAELMNELASLKDYHGHHLLDGYDKFDLKYRLYAVVSHSGEMSNGHYVAYARNPTGAWLCYNDSSCREISASPVEQASSGEPASNGDQASSGEPANSEKPATRRPPIDPTTAYILFYERQGLDYDAYLPDVRGKEPVIRSVEGFDDDDSDLKKMCVVI